MFIFGFGFQKTGLGQSNIDGRYSSNFLKCCNTKWTRALELVTETVQYLEENISDFQERIPVFEKTFSSHIFPDIDFDLIDRHNVLHKTISGTVVPLSYVIYAIDNIELY